MFKIMNFFTVKDRVQNKRRNNPHARVLQITEKNNLSE